jgi:polyisoprenoid-binding protein YceI
MKGLRRGIIVFGVMLFSINAFAQSVNWKVDTAKATIKIVTSGPFGEVDGSLSGLKATINFDENKPATGSITASVDPKTIATGIELRNTHLREKEEFFNTSKYPLISFKSIKIKKNDSGGYVVTGNLTIKNITKQVDIPFTFTKTATGALFKGQFSIDAVNYTVGTSSKSVTIYLNVPVVK